jgi:signal transduction histidine kinase
LSAQEQARQARELHDGLVQELWLARLTLGQLVGLPNLPEEAQALARRVDGALENALAEARQSMLTLQADGDVSLGTALRRQVEDFGDHFGLEVSFELESDPGPLDGKTQREILRICREALVNSRRHALAELARVTLTTTDAGLRVSIVDDGKGFDVNAPTSGMGLRSMAERAELLGGRLELRSSLSIGTQVVFELPLVRDEP